MVGMEYKPYVMEMGYLFPPSLADFLGTADEVHVFAEVTEHLDIRRLNSGFSGMGQHSYHPLMLLRLLMWGLASRANNGTDQREFGLQGSNPAWAELCSCSVVICLCSAQCHESCQVYSS